MFRTSYDHLQEDYIVHAALYVVFSMRLCKQSTRLKDVLEHHIRLHIQYSLPEDEHKMFETCRRQEISDQNTNLKSAFYWLTLNNL